MTKSNTPSAPGRRRTIFEGNNTAPAHEADDRGDAIVNARRDERHAEATLLERLDDLPLDRYERTGDGPHAVSFP